MNPAKPTIPELLNLRRYDPNQLPTPEQVLLSVGGKKVGTLQNLVTITGKQKNGKSRYIGAAIAAGITGQEIFQIKLRQPQGRPRIALFDTEQSDYDFYRQMQQIKTLAGIGTLPPTFDAFNTREDDPEETLKMIDHYLAANPDCSILFIDGILDLLMDFNNVIESKRLTNLIKRITKERQCLMVGVLHRGKGNDTTVGNIGSMADRLAQSVLKVEKNKDRNTYCLSADFMRSDEDFSPVEIWYNNGRWEETFSIPDPSSVPVKPIMPMPHEWEVEEHQEFLPLLFTDTYMRYEALAQMIKEVYGVGRNWAVECIKHLRAINLIFRHDQGYSLSRQTGAKLFIDAK